MFFNTEIEARPKGSDNRLTNRLTNYWNNVKSNDILPDIGNFNSQGLQDVLGQCCIWRVEIHKGDRAKTYTYEYFGTSLQNAIGKDLTGEKFPNALQNFPATKIMEKMYTLLESRLPLSDEGEFSSTAGKKVKYRSCLLPFGTKEGEITNILLGLSWSGFAENYAVEW